MALHALGRMRRRRYALASVGDEIVPVPVPMQPGMSMTSYFFFGIGVGVATHYIIKWLEGRS